MAKGRRTFCRGKKEDTQSLLTNSPKTLGRAKRMMFQNRQQLAQERAAMEANLRKSVILDVGGDRFLALRNTLKRYPSTRLGKLMMATTLEKIFEFCDEYVPGNPPEYFFDRNPDNFPAILNMYRTDKFHMNDAGCALVFQKDLEYWIIDDLLLEPCCSLKYFPEVEVCQSEKDGDLQAKLAAIKTSGASITPPTALSKDMQDKLDDLTRISCDK